MRSPGTPIGQESPIDRSRERHTGSRHNRSPRRRAPASLIHVTPPVLLEPGGRLWLTACEPDGTLPLTLCPPFPPAIQGLFVLGGQAESLKPTSAVILRVILARCREGRCRFHRSSR